MWLVPGALRVSQQLERFRHSIAAVKANYDASEFVRYVMAKMPAWMSELSSASPSP
jgi:hypothetical protein